MSTATGTSKHGKSATRFELVSMLLAGFSAISASAHAAPPEAIQSDVALRDGTLEVRRGLFDVTGSGVPTDRPELSAFGDELVYTVEEGPPDPVFILSIYQARKLGSNSWESPWLLREGRAGYDDGMLVSWYFPAFTPWDDTIISGKGTLHRKTDGTVDFLTLDTRFLTLDEEGREKDTLVTTAQLGLPFGEIPQGARVSPDGRWLAFFALSTPDVQGIYLYELEHGALHRLTMYADRDPVWSVDGRTLFFHQLGAGGSAQSAVGRVDLGFEGATPLSTRKLLDHVASAHSHVVDSADRPPRLAARRTCSGFVPVRIRLITSAGEIIAARRAATALQRLDATFLGKLAGDANYRVFTVDAVTVARVRALVGSMPCPRPRT
jgi:hypothetical protein